MNKTLIRSSIASCHMTLRTRRPDLSAIRMRRPRQKLNPRWKWPTMDFKQRQSKQVRVVTMIRLYIWKFIMFCLRKSARSLTISCNLPQTPHSRLPNMVNCRPRSRGISTHDADRCNSQLITRRQVEYQAYKCWLLPLPPQTQVTSGPAIWCVVLAGACTYTCIYYVHVYVQYYIVRVQLYFEVHDILNPKQS